MSGDAQLLAELTRATARLSQGDGRAALSALLRAWRIAHQPEIGDLVVEASPQVESTPVSLVGHKSFTEAFHARALSATDADIGALLQFVRGNVSRTPGFSLLAVELAERHPPDPRVADMLLELIDSPPFRRSHPSLYRRIFQALTHIDDPRAKQRILDLADSYRGTRRTAPFGHPGLRELHACADHFELRKEAPPLPDAAAALCSRLREHLAGSRERRRRTRAEGAELLLAIYADPSNTEARLIYADFLQELGDPRGELIALQCAREAEPAAQPTRRERDLIKTYGRLWMGAIEPVVLKSGFAYRRGFLGVCRYKAELVEHRQLVERPEWSTVEALDVAAHIYATGAAPLLLSQHMNALRRVVGLSLHDLEILDAHPDSLPWTHIGVRSWSATRLPLQTLPALSELDLTGAFLNQYDASWAHDRIDVLLGQPLIQRLEALALPASPPTWRSWLQAASEYCPRLQRLDLYEHRHERQLGDGLKPEYSGWKVSFQRATPGQPLDRVVASHGSRPDADPTRYLRHGLRRLDPGDLRELRIEVAPRTRLTPEQHAGLKATAEKLELQRCELP